MEDERYFEKRRERIKGQRFSARRNKRSRDPDSPESPVRRVVASFNKVQLQEVYDWMEETSSIYPQMSIPRALETIGGEKERERFGYGIKALLEIGRLGHSISEVRDVLVWKDNKGQSFIEGRYITGSK